MFHRSLLLPFVWLAVTVYSQNCNICGDGNTIGDSKSSVEFEYGGVKLKNSCLEWQEIVKNPNAISDEFCRSEMLQYTIDVCDCANAQGVLLSDLPTPKSVTASDSSPSVAPNSVQAPVDNSVVVKCQKETGSKEGCSDEMKDTSAADGVTGQMTIWHFVGLAWLMGCM
jgi:hypothetical protein